MMQEFSTTESGSAGVDRKSPRLNRIFILACSILALVKLWLVRGDDVPCLGSPFDDIWYLQSAKDWYWLRSYNDLTFGTPPYVRLPAYPLYLALVNLTGVPLRIVNELLMLFAAFVFVWVLIKAGQSQLLGVLFFAAIIFHSGSFLVNSLAYPDNLYASFLLFSLAGLILLLIKRDDPHRCWYALVTGIALAILWHIRQENIIITGFFGVFAVLLYLNARRESQPPRGKLRQFIVLVGIPFVAIMVASLVVKTVNYYRIGVFAGDAMYTSDFEAASKALVRIKPKVPLRYVAVPREVRERAYEVSPAFKELQSYFEGEPGRFWASAAKQYAGLDIPGEISTGHIWWGLNQATYYAGYNKSAGQAGKFYRRVAAEINAACDGGRLECRPVLSSLIDPESRNYVPHLRHSFSQVTHLFNTVNESHVPGDMVNLPLEIRDLADSITNRRAAFRSDGPLPVREPEAAIKSFIWRHHGKLIELLTYAGLCGLLLLVICYRRLDLKDPAFSIMALLLAVVASRVLIFTYIDACWYAINDIRYVFPVAYLYTGLLLMLICCAFRLVASGLRHNSVWQRIGSRGVFEKAPDQFGKGNRQDSSTAGSEANVQDKLRYYEEMLC